MPFKKNKKFENRIDEYIYNYDFWFYYTSKQNNWKKLVSFANYVKKSTRWEQSGICGSRRLVMGSKWSEGMHFEDDEKNCVSGLATCHP